MFAFNKISCLLTSIKPKDKDWIKNEASPWNYFVM